METVTHRQVLELWAELCGLNPNVSAQDRATFNRFFVRVARRGWEWEWWTPLMQLEERFYRDAWSAQSWASGAEVWHSATNSYYRATSATVAGDVPGASPKWLALSTLDPYVARDQAGQTPIGAFRSLWLDNFRTNRRARQLRWELDERGASITSDDYPRSVWVYFRPRCPEWRGADYAAASTYSSGRILYYASATPGFEGDFWQALAAINQNDSPEAAPAKWRKLEIPAFLCDFAAQGAAIGFLQGDGQLEKALASRGSLLWDYLYDEADKERAQNPKVRRARVANL